MNYGYVLEPGQKGWFAYVPDLPGCVGAGDTPQKAAANIRSAVKVYVEELRKTGKDVPPPSREIKAYPETEPGYRVIQPPSAE